MDDPVNPLERDHSLFVVLPGGLEKNATVHGSKPVMDLLVTLCASYHLNPSDYTVEVLSPNKNSISFKPNSPIGSLEAETIVLKPRGAEEKIRRPYMPEATVRLLINYNKSHKAVVRVNPRLPLEMLLPLVCDKCEFRAETTVLLRDSRSSEPLDLSKTLNDHGLREVFAKDAAADLRPGTPEAAVAPAEALSAPALQDPPKKEKKQKENAGFLSLFRRKKKTDTDGAASAPASPGRHKPAAAGAPGVPSSNAPPADAPKKRRAPQPPMGASQSVPSDLSTCHTRGPQRSGESSVRSTKRRAPPPPCANAPQELQEHPQVKDSLDTAEVPRDSANLPPSSPRPSPSPRSRPSFDSYLPSVRGKDLSDARCALARVLTSSVSKGTLVKRLRSSATFPKFYGGSSFMSVPQRCRDNGVLCAELESVLKSNVPTEPEWEDPLQRKGMTTFKVVPSKTLKSPDPELAPDAADQGREDAEDNAESEASPEAKSDLNEREEDLYSPRRSDAETPQELRASDGPDSPPPPRDLANQACTGPPPPELEDGDEGQKEEEEEDEPGVASEATAAAPSDCGDEEVCGEGQIRSEDQRAFLQSGSNADEEVAGEVEEDSFPPPPPPVFFTEDAEVMEEVPGDAGASPPPSSQPASPTRDGRAGEFDGDRTDRSAEAAPGMSTAPSRFAQAVALAVQRSRLQSLGKAFGPRAPAGPQSALPSPPRSTYQYGCDRASVSCLQRKGVTLNMSLPQVPDVLPESV